MDVVPKWSAIPSGLASAEQIEIDTNHTDLVNFDSLENKNFQKKNRNLRHMANLAQESVEQSWVKNEQEFHIKEGTLSTLI
jgi:hypothetical protein